MEQNDTLDYSSAFDKELFFYRGREINCALPVVQTVLALQPQTLSHGAMTPPGAGQLTLCNVWEMYTPASEPSVGQVAIKFVDWALRGYQLFVCNFLFNSCPFL